MEDLIGASEVTCDALALDDYGRTLAICFADERELNRSMVSVGLAWAFRRYSNDYVAEEETARAARLGVWQAMTEPPWDYRAHRWEVAVQEGPSGCPIKGNVNREGERIYHAPWSPWYDRTRIDTAQGEQWFCSEGEAVSAGWRAPFWGR
jgi:hypothetical protein